MATHRQVLVGNQTITVDSMLEERMLLWLENNGYSKHWSRPEKGLNAGSKNYTPDILLYVEYGGGPQLAIVEIKPTLRGRFGFSDYIYGRMKVAASVYFAKLLILYVAAVNKWFQIDYKTGKLTEIELPPPANKPISEAYKPIVVKAPSVWSHKYNRRLDHTIANAIADATLSGLQSLFGTKKRPRKKSNRRGRKY